MASSSSATSASQIRNGEDEDQQADTLLSLINVFQEKIAYYNKIILEFTLLGERNEELEAKLLELNQTLESLRETLSKKEEKLNDEVAKHKNTERRLEQLQLQLRQAKSQNQTNLNSSKTAEKQVQDLRLQNKCIERQKADMEQKYSIERDEWRKKMSQLELQFQQQKTQHVHEMSIACKKIDETEAHLNDSNATNQKLRTDVQSLENKLKTLTELKNSNEKDIKKLCQTLKQIQSQNEADKVKIGELETHVAQLQQKNREFEVEVSKSQEDIGKYKAQLEESEVNDKEMLQEFNLMKAVFTTKEQQLTTNLEAKEKEVHEANEKIQSLYSQLKEQRSSINRTQSRIEDLEFHLEKFEKLKIKLHEAEIKCVALQDELEKAKIMIPPEPNLTTQQLEDQTRHQESELDTTSKLKLKEDYANLTNEKNRLAETIKGLETQVQTEKEKLKEAQIKWTDEFRTLESQLEEQTKLNHYIHNNREIEVQKIKAADEKHLRKEIQDLKTKIADLENSKADFCMKLGNCLKNVKKYKTQFEEIRTKLDEQNKVSEVLEAEKNELKNEVDQLKIDLEISDQKNKELAKENQKQVQDLRNSENQMGQLTQSNEKLVLEAEDYSRKNRRLIREHEHLNSSITNLLSEKRKHEELLKSNNLEIATLKQQIQDVQQMESSLQEENLNFRRVIQDTSKKFQQLNSTVEEKDAEIKNMQLERENDVKDLNEKIGVLRQKIVQGREYYDKLKNAKTLLETELETLKINITGPCQSCKTLEIQVDRLNVVNYELKEQMKIQEENSASERKKSQCEIQRLRSVWVKCNVMAKEKVKALEIAKQASVNELAASKNEVERLENDVNILAATAISTRDEYEQNINEMSKLRDDDKRKLEDAQKVVTNYEGIIERATKDIKTLRDKEKQLELEKQQQADEVQKLNDALKKERNKTEDLRSDIERRKIKNQRLEIELETEKEKQQEKSKELQRRAGKRRSSRSDPDERHHSSEPKVKRRPRSPLPFRSNSSRGRKNDYDYRRESRNLTRKWKENRRSKEELSPVSASEMPSSSSSSDSDSEPQPILVELDDTSPVITPSRPNRRSRTSSINKKTVHVEDVESGEIYESST